MRQVVVSIDDDKYGFFLELIKSIDFATIEPDGDWYDMLSDADKESIQQGEDDIKAGRVKTHEEALLSISKRLEHMKTLA